MESPDTPLQSALRRGGAACRQCGGLSLRASPKGRLSKICSDECAIGRRRATKNASARRTGRVRAEPLPPRGCISCAAKFVPAKDEHVACSRRCSLNRRMLRRVRLLRKAPGVAHPVDKVVHYGWIRRRDGWTCQACGVATPREALKTGRPDAPELGHIIPLARGGFHQPGNLWLLCLSCNRSKGARDPFEFLASRLAGDPVRMAAAFVRAGSVLATLET